jgi:DNA-binding NarL/FixJ family response regulator
MAARIVESLFGQAAKEGMGVERLSDREFEVFQLIGQGLSAHEIGRRLHLSAKTVDAHRANIKTKLNIGTAPELISFAASWAAHEAKGA